MRLNSPIYYRTGHLRNGSCIRTGSTDGDGIHTYRKPWPLIIKLTATEQPLGHVPPPLHSDFEPCFNSHALTKSMNFIPETAIKRFPCSQLTSLILVTSLDLKHLTLHACAPPAHQTESWSLLFTLLSLHFCGLKIPPREDYKIVLPDQQYLR